MKAVREEGADERRDRPEIVDDGHLHRLVTRRAWSRGGWRARTWSRPSARGRILPDVHQSLVLTCRAGRVGRAARCGVVAYARAGAVAFRGNGAGPLPIRLIDELD